MSTLLNMDNRAKAPADAVRAVSWPKWLRLQTCVTILFFVVLAVLPVATTIVGEPYFLTFASRVVIMGLAALGLNLILGYGGLVSFGHALYIGIGAYAVGIAAEHGIHNGFVHLLIAFAVGGGVAMLVGAISLRTTGMGFIMITLAFAQMAYVLAVSLKRYGGEDGLQIAARSDFIFLDLSNPVVLYYTAFVLLVAATLLTSRLVTSRFGMVLRATKFNERRMTALGFKTFQFKLSAYVISALICVLAGVLLANLMRFVSPSYMQWTVSGELIIMVVLGGMGTVLGPVMGAAVLLGIEEQLSSLNIGLPGIDAFIRSHWLAFLGVFIVVITLSMKRGIYGSLSSSENRS